MSNIKDLSIAQLKDVITKAPDSAELYHPISKTYIRGAFSEGQIDYFAKWSSFQGWMLSSTHDASFLDTCVLLSDIQTHIAELEDLSLSMDNVVSIINSGKFKDDDEFTRFKNDMKYPVEPKENLPELIVCAANRDPETGKVYLCVRHGCDMFWQQIVAEFGDDKNCCHFDQGFYTNKRRFVSREEAYKIAKANSQIKRLCPTKSKRLYSEMLY